MPKDKSPFAVSTDKKGKVIAITDTSTGEKLPQKYVRRMRNEMKKKQPFTKKPFDNSVKIVKIKCVKCGKTRKVFSSDFFQVTTCIDCTKLAKAEKKAAKADEIKEALALLAARKAEASK